MDQDEEEDSRPVIPPPPVPLPLPTSSVQPQVRGSSRSTCDRCGQQYACTYLRYHQRRCVGVMAHAQADGRGGAGARIAAIRAEARGGRQGGRRRLLDPPAQPPFLLHLQGMSIGLTATTISSTTGATQLTSMQLNSRSVMQNSNKATTSCSTCQHQREGW